MPKRRANGEGSITQRKDGLWMAQYIDSTGKRHTLYGKRQQEVKNKLKEAIRQSDSGISADSNKVTFADWMAEWLEVYSRPMIKESTYALYYNSIHNHIIPEFQNILLKDLRPDMLQKFFNKKALSGRRDKRKNPDTGEFILKDGGLGISTLYKMKILILLALNAAIDNNLINQNAVQKIKLPKKRTPDVTILSVEEQKKLEDAILSDDRPLSFCIMLALYTGLRVGELAALKIEDINFESKELRVRRSTKRVSVKDEAAKTRIIISEPKTAKSKRIIPLPDFIIDMLEKHIAERNTYIEIIKECFHSADEKWIDEGFLFITRNGGAQEQSNISALFEQLLKIAEIKHIKFHALRHTFATRCIEAGFDIKSLSDILGHTDAKTTLNTYTHALTDQKRKNMEKLYLLSSKNKNDNPES